MESRVAPPASGGQPSHQGGRWGWLIGGVIAVIIIGVVWVLAANKEPTPSSDNPIVSNYQKQLPALADTANEQPSSAKAQADYAVALYATGDISQAKDYYEKAVKLDADNATLRNNLGNTYRDLGDYQKAVDNYQKAIALDAKATNAYMNLANLYLYTLDQAEIAIKTYQEALRNIPDNQELQVLLGIAYEQSGDKASAKATYQAVLQQNPANAAAQAGLERVE